MYLLELFSCCLKIAESVEACSRVDLSDENLNVNVTMRQHQNVLWNENETESGNGGCDTSFLWK